MKLKIGDRVLHKTSQKKAVVFELGSLHSVLIMFDKGIDYGWDDKDRKKGRKFWWTIESELEKTNEITKYYL